MLIFHTKIVSQKPSLRLPKAVTSSPKSRHFVSQKPSLRLPKAVTSSPKSRHFVSQKPSLRLPKAVTSSPDLTCFYIHVFKYPSSWVCMYLGT